MGSFSNSESGKFHHCIFNNFLIIAGEKRYLITLAGTPPTIAYGGISFVTTAPAATIAPSPIFLHEFNIMAFLPIQTSLPIIAPFD